MKTMTVEVNKRSALSMWLYKLLALASLAMAVLGILLPGLPATEFVILAAWAAAKGSPTIHQWIMSVPYFRRIIDNWQHGGVISRRNKVHSALSMLACFTLLVVMEVAYLWLAVAALGMGIGAFFIWRRPETRPLVTRDKS